MQELKARPLVLGGEFVIVGSLWLVGFRKRVVWRNSQPVRWFWEVRLVVVSSL